MIESCELFPNYAKSDYKRYSEIPLERRLDTGSAYADITLTTYWNRHIGGDGKLPTSAEHMRLERLADYILAEDHVKGFMTIRDPYEELDAISVCYPPGEGAIEFMRKHDDIFCIADAEPYADGKHTKLCGVCGYVFEDFTRPKNKKYCGPSCVKIHEARALRIRKHGSESYEGERNRMSAEYPFYSPAEMRLLEERSEVSHGGYDKLERLYSAKERKKTMGGHKNEVKLVDIIGTPGQKYLDGQYGWVSNRNSGRKSVKNDNSSIWWGSVVTYNIKEQPLTEKFKEAKFCSRVLRQRWEGNSSSFPFINLK